MGRFNIEFDRLTPFSDAISYLFRTIFNAGMGCFLENAASVNKKAETQYECREYQGG